MNKESPLDRLALRLDADGHDDEAHALRIVDFLMRAYGFTDDPLTDDAKMFATDLRRLVGSWISGSD